MSTTGPKTAQWSHVGRGWRTGGVAGDDVEPGRRADVGRCRWHGRCVHSAFVQINTERNRRHQSEEREGVERHLEQARLPAGA